MAGLRVSIEGERELIRNLELINPALNHRITEPALIESALLSMRISAQEKIQRGRAKKATPLANKLTFRTGRLTASLSVNTALDRSNLPRFIEAGTNLVYGAVHERGNRPFLAPGLLDASKRFETIFIQAWRRQL